MLKASAYLVVFNTKLLLKEKCKAPCNFVLCLKENCKAIHDGTVGRVLLSLTTTIDSQERPYPAEISAFWVRECLMAFIFLFSNLFFEFSKDLSLYCSNIF